MSNINNAINVVKQYIKDNIYLAEMFSDLMYNNVVSETEMKELLSICIKKWQKELLFNIINDARYKNKNISKFMIANVKYIAECKYADRKKISNILSSIATALVVLNVINDNTEDFTLHNLVPFKITNLAITDALVNYLCSMKRVYDETFEIPKEDITDVEYFMYIMTGTTNVDMFILNSIIETMHKFTFLLNNTTPYHLLRDIYHRISNNNIFTNEYKHLPKIYHNLACVFRITQEKTSKKLYKALNKLIAYYKDEDDVAIKYILDLFTNYERTGFPYIYMSENMIELGYRIYKKTNNPHAIGVCNVAYIDQRAVRYHEDTRYVLSKLNYGEHDKYVEEEYQKLCSEINNYLLNLDYTKYNIGRENLEIAIKNLINIMTVDYKLALILINKYGQNVFDILMGYHTGEVSIYKLTRMLLR